MASLGPNNPGTITNVNSDGGNAFAWTNISNVAASDNAYATRVISTLGTLGGISDDIQCTNFGFAVPAGATINGIVVEIERKQNSASPNLKDSSVKLIKGGTVSGTDKASASSWPTADAYATYGTSSDLWGLALTDTDVNASNFGVTLRVIQSINGGKSTNTASVDHIRMTVYYTGGGGGSFKAGWAARATSTVGGSF